MGIICGGLNAYCMQTRPLFLRTSGSSGVPKALLLERNGQLSCIRVHPEIVVTWPCELELWRCSASPDLSGSELHASCTSSVFRTAKQQVKRQAADVCQAAAPCRAAQVRVCL